MTGSCRQCNHSSSVYHKDQSSDPLLFVMYTAELHQVVSTHGLILHQYADDCQVYLSTFVGDAPDADEHFSRCLVDVEDWMSTSRLQLNPTKAQVMWLGSK